MRFPAFLQIAFLRCFLAWKWKLSLALPLPCTPYNGTGFQLLGIGYYYQSATFSGTFSIARQFCKSLHPYSDLAVLKEPENWDIVKSYLPTGKQKWLGLFQDMSRFPIYEPDNNWTWVDDMSTADGIVNPYFYSIPGEPDDYYDEACCYFQNGKMYDYDCSATFEALCSIPSNVSLSFALSSYICSLLSSFQLLVSSRDSLEFKFKFLFSL
jgi:hypothetical protein